MLTPAIINQAQAILASFNFATEVLSQVQMDEMQDALYALCNEDFNLYEAICMELEIA